MQESRFCGPPRWSGAGLQPGRELAELSPQQTIFWFVQMDPLLLEVEILPQYVFVRRGTRSIKRSPFSAFFGIFNITAGMKTLQLSEMPAALFAYPGGSSKIHLWERLTLVFGKCFKEPPGYAEVRLRNQSGRGGRNREETPTWPENAKCSWGAEVGKTPTIFLLSWAGGNGDLGPQDSGGGVWKENLGLADPAVGRASDPERTQLVPRCNSVLHAGLRSNLCRLVSALLTGANWSTLGQPGGAGGGGMESHRAAAQRSSSELAAASGTQAISRSL